MRTPGAGGPRQRMWRLNIDLRGGTKCWSHELSVDVRGVLPDEWGADDLRRAAAEHYGLPLERIPRPVLYTRRRLPIDCDHDFQMHPASDDFGVCAKCGAEVDALESETT